MVRIGFFSRISQVSIQTLRYYDRLGLLTPKHIDPLTGYRYYTLDQLAQVNRILALRDIGLSLDQIGFLLDNQLSVTEVRAMLLLKLAQLEQQKQAIETQLALATTRLHQIEQEGIMPDYEIIIKRVDPIQVVSSRGYVADTEDFGPVFLRLLESVKGHVSQHQAEVNGSWMAVFHDPDVREEQVDIEVALPIQSNIPAGDHVVIQTLPAVEQMACTVHHGPPKMIIPAFQAMARWIETNHYRVSGPYREIYHRSELNGDTDEEVTEIQFPIEKF